MPKSTRRDQAHAESRPTAAGVYKIGDVAEKTGLNVHVLRVWERRHGLLVPTRTSTRHRLYSDDDLRVLGRVQQLLHQGFAIGQIARMGRERLLLDSRAPDALAGGPVPDASLLHGSRCEAALTQMPSAVILTNPQGITQWINPAFTELCGYTLSDLRGHPPGKMLQGPATDVETARRIGAAIREVRPSSERIVNYDKRRRLYWVLLDIAPLWIDSVHQGFIGVARDLTRTGEAPAPMEPQRG